MVKDSTTILIGGLIEETLSESTREVPGLADIPLLGSIFRSKTKGSADTTPEKTELVIFLTPHIITGDESKDLLTLEKVAHEVEAEKIETEQEFDKLNMSSIAADESLTKAYCDLISAMIMQRADTKKPASPVYGEVIISFALNRDGTLASTPQTEEGSSTALTKIGIESIKDASPFPPFPASMDAEQETFKIAISYQRQDGSSGKKLSGSIESPIGQYIGDN
jgi:hypothetical protein